MDSVRGIFVGDINLLRRVRVFEVSDVSNLDIIEDLSDEETLKTVQAKLDSDEIYKSIFLCDVNPQIAGSILKLVETTELNIFVSEHIQDIFSSKNITQVNFPAFDQARTNGARIA